MCFAKSKAAKDLLRTSENAMQSIHKTLQLNRRRCGRMKRGMWTVCTTSDEQKQGRWERSTLLKVKRWCEGELYNYQYFLLLNHATSTDYPHPIIHRQLSTMPQA